MGRSSPTIPPITSKEIMKKDSYLGMSSRRRRALLDQTLALHGWVCCICGLTIAPGDESLQHLVPRAHGGSNDPSNLRPAHRLCNSQLGARPTEGPAATIHNGLGYFPRPAEPTRFL